MSPASLSAHWTHSQPVEQLAVAAARAEARQPAARSNGERLWPLAAWVGLSSLLSKLVGAPEDGHNFTAADQNSRSWRSSKAKTACSHGGRGPAQAKGRHACSCTALHWTQWLSTARFSHSAMDKQTKTCMYPQAVHTMPQSASASLCRFLEKPAPLSKASQSADVKSHVLACCTP